jgi:hypothetical protein
MKISVRRTPNDLYFVQIKHRAFYDRRYVVLNSFYLEPKEAMSLLRQLGRSMISKRPISRP